MTADTAATALTGTHGHQAGANQSAMVDVARKARVSPLRQFTEIFRLARAEGKVNTGEYYEFQLWRPELDMAAKKEFVGEHGSFMLNRRLAPPQLTHIRGFLSDKLAFTTFAAGLGFPTTRTLVAFHPTRSFGSLPTLRTAADVMAYLRTAPFPLFGKPISGLQAKGSARLLGVEGEDVLLPRGRIPLSRLADEIVAYAEDGYLLQETVEVDPAIQAMTGTETVATLRVVTINRTGRPELLYSCWKLPSLTAVSDNFWQEGSLIAAVDATGTITKVRRGTGLATEWVDRHPSTGAALVGEPLPHYRAAVDLAVDLHATVPSSGVLGWDIALVPGGARLIECNENTGHMLYQLSHDRGVLNAGFRPIFAEIEARNAARRAEFKKAYRDFRKEQIRA